MQSCDSEKMAPLMTAEEVGDCLRVSRKAVYEMVHKGEIPQNCIVRIGRRLRFERPGLEQWLKEKRGK